MKKVEDWLSEYGESHRHPTNRIIHKFCVPLIVYTLIAMLWALPFPLITPSPLINWAGILTLIALVFYFSLGFRPGIFMALFILPLFIFLKMIGTEQAPIIFQISGVLFIIAWIFQFIGHKIEGKRPSFLKDLFFLLIGPLWVFRPLWKIF